MILSTANALHLANLLPENTAKLANLYTKRSLLYFFLLQTTL
jgi:hypothetical protein